ncbi:MAG: hypothetical protein IKM85_06545 [Bacteroidales bacterium]|nr:hypothetical protein [Bacteroidales bacterium]
MRRVLRVGFLVDYYDIVTVLGCGWCVNRVRRFRSGVKKVGAEVRVVAVRSRCAIVADKLCPLVGVVFVGGGVVGVGTDTYPLVAAGEGVVHVAVLGGLGGGIHDVEIGVFATAWHQVLCPTQHVVVVNRGQQRHLTLGQHDSVSIGVEEVGVGAFGGCQVEAIRFAGRRRCRRGDTLEDGSSVDG